MRVEAVLVGPAGSEPIVIEADEAAVGRDLARVLAARANVDIAGAQDAPVSLELSASGRVVDLAAPLRRAGIVHGDRLEVRAVRIGPARLTVEAGPEPGRIIVLESGSWTIGRQAAHSDIVIADRSISRPHCKFEVADGIVTVHDLGSSNGTRIEGRRIEQPTLLRDGDRLTMGSVVVVASLPGPPQRMVADPAPLTVDDQGRIEFHRAPRIVARPEEQTIRLPTRPPAPPPRRFPVAAALIPLALGLILYLVTGEVSTLGFALVAPAMVIGSVLEDRRSGRLTYEGRVAEHEATLVRLEQRILDARERELTRLQDQGPDIATTVRRGVDVDSRLWERQPNDADFLLVRVGSGPVPLTGGIRVEGIDDPSPDIAEVVAHVGAPSTDGAPVLLPLAQIGVLGICGPSEARRSLARAIEIRLRVDHSPEDVAIDRALTPAQDSEATIVSFVDIDDLPDRRAAGPLLEAAAPGRRMIVWGAADRRSLPSRCEAVLELGPREAVLTAPGTALVGITVDQASASDLDAVERALARVVDADASRGSSIPDQVGLREVLEGMDPGRPSLDSRWSAPPPGLAAPLGVGADGPVVLDLRAAGPHLLVAGTTGAGKSELLQTLVTGMAASHPPERLTFLLVDYKGGSAFRDAQRLPHTVGFVTDLDGHLTQRALIALNAELHRRERMVFDAQVNDLAALEARSPELAPPALVVVIDEFAALVSEVPEFVDGVVDLAQRGRSLGIHLVLATQRPAGIVSDKIRANINARIALRVTDRQDSVDVIGSPDAAQISRAHPGRAYLRIGTEAPREIQTAWAGSTSAPPGRRAELVTVRGVHEPALTAGSETDLESLVAEAIDAAARRHSPSPRRPWLPPLPKVIDLAELPVAHDEAQPIIGIVDRPERQSQVPFSIDLSQGGAVLYGTSRSGLSTGLRTVAIAAARAAGPDRLHVYGIDFGTRALASLEVLPHCGSIVPGEDQDRVARLLGRLRTEVGVRRERLGRASASSIDELRDSGESMPRILFLIDDYAAFSAAFERVELGRLVDQVVRLASEGSALGIHLVISAPRRAAVPGALAGVMPTRIVYRMAEREEMVMAGADPTLARSMTFSPGRAIVEGTHELQTAVLGGVPGTAEHAALRRLAAQVDEVPLTARAPEIGAMPDQVDHTTLPPATDILHVPLGIGGDAETAVWLDLRDTHALVAGPQRSGRSTALHAIARAALASGADVRLVAARRSPLRDVVGWSASASGDDAAGLLGPMVDELAARDETSDPILLLVDDADELTPDAERALETVIRRGRDRAVRVVGSVEVRSAHRAFSGPVTELRKAKVGLLLRPDNEVDGDLLGVRLGRASGPVPVGRAALVVDGHVEWLQVAT